MNHLSSISFSHPTFSANILSRDEYSQKKTRQAEDRRKSDAPDDHFAVVLSNTRTEYVQLNATEMLQVNALFQQLGGVGGYTHKKYEELRRSKSIGESRTTFENSFWDDIKELLSADGKIK